MKCKNCSKKLSKIQIQRGNRVCSIKCRGEQASIFLSSKENPWRGRHHTNSTKRKIGEANARVQKGRRHSPHTEFKKGHPKPINGYRFPKGKRNFAWGGGKYQSFRHSLMRLFEYTNWRRQVFKRDHYTCQLCGQVGGYLQADHIKWFATIIVEHKIKTVKQALACKELWDIQNGRTLCLKCHRKETLKEDKHMELGNKYLEKYGFIPYGLQIRMRGLACRV